MTIYDGWVVRHWNQHVVGGAIDGTAHFRNRIHPRQAIGIEETSTDILCLVKLQLCYVDCLFKLIC